jgi:hypothetical protein
MILYCFFFFELICFYNGELHSAIINVHEIGFDDGITETRQKDYTQAVLDAKRKACEKAGCTIESKIKTTNAMLYQDLIESFAKSQLLPGYDIKDIGYVNGTYQVSLSGKVRTVDDDDPIRPRPPTKKYQHIDHDCKCEHLTYVCKDTLWAYERGEFVHDELGTFINIVKTNLYGYELKNVRRITITGFADGFPNNGVKDWKELPKRCNPDDLTGELNDKELAKARGCYVKYKLEQVLTKNSIAWSGKEIDYPDFTRMTDYDRKVVIEYHLDNKGNCQ